MTKPTATRPTFTVDRASFPLFTTWRAAASWLSTPGRALQCPDCGEVHDSAGEAFECCDMRSAYPVLADAFDGQLTHNVTADELSQEFAMIAETSQRATLTGHITITPALDHDEMGRLTSSGYVKVVIANGPSDDMGRVEQRGTAIVPGPVEPLSTGGVARDIKDLIAAFPGHRFEGSLARTAAAKFGSAQSRITVLTDGTVRY